MRNVLLIISTSILGSSNADLQDQMMIDSTVRIFVVQPGYGDGCNISDGLRFQVLPDRTQFSPDVFILKSHLAPISIENNALYAVRGYTATRKELVNGCGSARWEENRTYIIPVRSVLFIRKKLTPHYHF